MKNRPAHLRLAGIHVEELHRHLFPGDGKEAVAFALLAHETMQGRPGNIPAATGSPRDMRLGTVHRP